MNKIFISSTCYDLIDLRAELKEYINSLGLSPIMSDNLESKFEIFPDQNSIETCLINLRSCDVVILILSQRYGPSLAKAGFTDYSATHLEYLEAVKCKIKTIVFVRDRLEADFTNFKKTRNEKSLVWIEPKEQRLFEIIDAHKKLENDTINNWYWTFKNSVDLKSRLAIDLKSEIKENRLNNLINSGNMPILVINSVNFNKCGVERYALVLKIANMGNQSAIDPNALIFKAKNYKEVIENNLEKSILNYVLVPIPSLMAGEMHDSNVIYLEIKNNEIINNNITIVVEIVFKTIYGDLISDISELDIYIGINPIPKTFQKYKIKRYRHDEGYQRLTKLE